MQLSDYFRYVIENMPCYEQDDTDIEEYINEFIFDYFGFTYITRILLGGTAQENIIIDRQTHEKMVNEGINTKHQAQLSFQFKFGIATKATTIDDAETATYNSFMKQTLSTHATTLGGDPSLTTISEWSKTVPSNPVVVQFTVRDIFRLLNTHYFPNDTQITQKSALIKLALDKYLNKTSDYCYGNCGENDDSRGICVSSGYFKFGTCDCKQPWSGGDCTIRAATTNKILHGTVCGFDRSFIRVNCDGLRPHSQGCPSGWIQKYWDTDLTICFKSGTSIMKPVVGTLCGLYINHNIPRFMSSSHIPCNNIALDGSSSLNQCPPSYQKVTATTPSVPGSQSYTITNTLCMSVNADEDVSGTICGMQIEDTQDGLSCDGYNPGLRQCPPMYSVRRTVFGVYGFLVCVKN